MAETFVAGWTDPIDYQLLANGSPFNLNGYVITLEAKNMAGASAVWAGAVSVTDAAAGKVQFLPGPNDLTAGQYRVRWKATKDGRSGFFPRGESELWIVVA